MFNIPLHFLVQHPLELLVSYSNGYYVAKVLSVFTAGDYSSLPKHSVFHLNDSFNFNVHLNFEKQEKKCI